jgi:antitoxin (DNA-binding transcriptional repressor) of toxin-antitoxin stability system
MGDDAKALHPWGQCVQLLNPITAGSGCDVAEADEAAALLVPQGEERRREAAP